MCSLPILDPCLLNPSIKDQKNCRLQDQKFCVSLSHVVCCSLLCSRLRWSQTRRNSDSETLGPCLKCSSLYACVLFQNGQSMLFLLINGINFSWRRYKCRDINNRLELTCILEIFASCLLSKMKQGLNESQFLAFPFH